MLRKLQKSQKVNFRAVARSAVGARQFDLQNFNPAVAYATAGLAQRLRAGKELLAAS